MSHVDVKVPDIGDFAEVSVIELLVKPGDNIAVEQSLVVHKRMSFTTSPCTSVRRKSRPA